MTCVVPEEICSYVCRDNTCEHTCGNPTPHRHIRNAPKIKCFKCTINVQLGQCTEPQVVTSLCQGIWYVEFIHRWLQSHHGIISISTFLLSKIREAHTHKRTRTHRIPVILIINVNIIKGGMSKFETLGKTDIMRSKMKWHDKVITHTHTQICTHTPRCAFLWLELGVCVKLVEFSRTKE